MQKIGFDSFFDIYSSLNITPQQTRKKTPKIRKIQIAIKSGKIDQNWFCLILRESDSLSLMSTVSIAHFGKRGYDVTRILLNKKTKCRKKLLFPFVVSLTLLNISNSFLFYNNKQTLTFAINQMFWDVLIQRLLIYRDILFQKNKKTRLFCWRCRKNGWPLHVNFFCIGYYLHTNFQV